MKAASLTWLAVYVLVAIGLAAWFFVRFPAWPTAPPSLPDAAFRIKAAIGAGLLVGLPALAAFSMLHSSWARLQERADVARAAAGGRPADGKRSAFYGQIHRDGPALVAPLSRRECLLYRYEVSHIQTRSRFGSNRTSGVTVTDSIVDAEGFALTPSTIHTAGGAVKLLTLAKLEFVPDSLRFEAIAENYKDYVATAPLKGTGTLDAHDRLLRSLLRPSDAGVRYDLGTGELSGDVAYLIKEHIVQHGDHVAVFGVYSAARGGIVSDPESIEPIDVRLRRGSLESLKRGLAIHAAQSLFGAMALCAVAAGGVWVFFRFGPSHIWN